MKVLGARRCWLENTDFVGVQGEWQLQHLAKEYLKNQEAQSREGNWWPFVFQDTMEKNIPSVAVHQRVVSCFDFSNSWICHSTLKGGDRLLITRLNNFTQKPISNFRGWLQLPQLPCTMPVSTSKCLPTSIPISITGSLPGMDEGHLAGV